MDGDGETPYITVSGMNVYASSQEDLAAILPVTVNVSANGGTVHTIRSSTTVLRGSYSPSGNWMPFFITLSSEDQITIPNNGTTFNISVTVTPNSGTALSFTESACGPIANSITCPDRMVTGRVYSFTAGSSFPVGASYKTTAELTWFPKMSGVYTSQVYEEGYVNAYTKTTEATSSFYIIYFAVANRDGLPGSEAAGLQTDANIIIQTKYLSASFTNGIVITEITARTPCSPRDDVDSDLAPVLTNANVTLTAAPETAVISEKYVHRQATITCTPVAQYKYGDSLSYIRINDETNRYGSSISFQAIGVEPGTSYVRPDTGQTETATQESVAGVTVCVYGSKWKLASTIINKTYTVVWYHAPSLSNFVIHRCSESSTSTAYYYNNRYYKKDDFGSNCLIEYQVNFSPLNNTNTTDMNIQYGTHRMQLTPTYTQSGFVVVDAPTNAKLDVVIVLYDLFYPYGTSSKLTLSVGSILMDFLYGGRGIAIGKNATELSALDIASDWRLYFYQATIGGYNGSASQDLIAWMHDMDNRLYVLENTRYANT